MTFSALIFDHDGTLVDSELLHFACWFKVMQTFGVNISEQEYIDYHNGISTLQNAELFVNTYSLDIEPADLTARKHQCYTQCSEQQAPPLMPYVLETLQLAHTAGTPMAIATGTTRDDLVRSCTAHGFNNYIQTSATRNDVEHGKPAPDVYLLACEKLGVSPSSAVAFEDTPIGVQAARAAGLYTVAIPNRYSAASDLGDANAVYGHLKEAYEALLT